MVCSRWEFGGQKILDFEVIRFKMLAVFWTVLEL